MLDNCLPVSKDCMTWVYIPAPNEVPDELCHTTVSFMYNLFAPYQRLSEISKLTNKIKIKWPTMKFYVSESILFRKIQI